MDGVFEKQDAFLQRMIEMWKQDERLRPFDLYFRWKTGEVSTDVWRKSRDAIRQMRIDSKRMIDEQIDSKTFAVKDEELFKVVDAIDSELINVSMILVLL